MTEQRYTEAKVILAKIGECQATKNERLAQHSARRGAEGANSKSDIAERIIKANVAGRPRVLRMARDHGQRKITMMLALRFRELSSWSVISVF
tara:strand:+ start:141 stop:419 length:279 start_codon:yes stop_codon:yes gene_type:complete